MWTSQRFFLLFFILFLTAGAFQSCKKYRLNRDTTSSQDNALADNTYSDAFAVVDDGRNNTDNLKKTSRLPNFSCANIKDEEVDHQVEDGDTIHTYADFTIDFGAQNCTGDDGRDRRGMIHVDYHHDHGASKLTMLGTFEDYYLDDNQVLGKLTIKIDTESGSGNPVVSLIVEEGHIITANDEDIFWNGNRDHELVEGALDSNDNTNKVWEITGEGDGVSRTERAFEWWIEEALVVRGDCKWIVSGMLSLQPEELDLRTIDYGDGTCNDEAKVTIGDNTYNIKQGG